MAKIQRGQVSRTSSGSSSGSGKKRPQENRRPPRPPPLSATSSKKVNQKRSRSGESETSSAQLQAPAMMARSRGERPSKRPAVMGGGFFGSSVRAEAMKRSPPHGRAFGQRAGADSTDRWGRRGGAGGAGWEWCVCLKYDIRTAMLCSSFHTAVVGTVLGGGQVVLTGFLPRWPCFRAVWCCTRSLCGLGGVTAVVSIPPPFPLCKDTFTAVGVAALSVVGSSDGNCRLHRLGMSCRASAALPTPSRVLCGYIIVSLPAESIETRRYHFLCHYDCCFVGRTAQEAACAWRTTPEAC